MPRPVCAIIKPSLTPAFSTSPPVSTTMHGTSVRRANPYWRSRVNPGRSATSASRVPVMALNKVDLPTLGRPINATTGSTLGRYFFFFDFGGGAGGATGSVAGAVVAGGDAAAGFARHAASLPP